MTTFCVRYRTVKTDRPGYRTFRTEQGRTSWITRQVTEGRITVVNTERWQPLPAAELRVGDMIEDPGNEPAWTTTAIDQVRGTSRYNITTGGPVFYAGPGRTFYTLRRD